MGNWKLVSRYERGPWELYDMDADRTELNDLCERDADQATRMSAAYEQWADACGVGPGDQLRELWKRR